MPERTSWNPETLASQALHRRTILSSFFTDHSKSSPDTQDAEIDSSSFERGAVDTELQDKRCGDH